MINYTDTGRINFLASGIGSWFPDGIGDSDDLHSDALAIAAERRRNSTPGPKDYAQALRNAIDRLIEKAQAEKGARRKP